MDLRKLEVIANWKIPLNIIEVLLFLGFYRFYRKFIKDYSKITISLTNLTKKNKL